MPPSGHIAGVYSRVDSERGVHKAPANELVRGALGLKYNISKGEQDLLNPKGIAVSKASGHIIVANNGANALSVFGSAAAGNTAPVATTPLPGNPWDVAYDEDGDRLFVALVNGTVAVIDAADPAALKLVTEIPVGTRPWGIALSADGSRLYTANGPSNDVSIVDTTALRMIKKIPAGKSPWGVVLGVVPGEKSRK